MTCVVSIHQPAYLPWLGYFDKIQRADKFIYLDTVQFQKNSFQNRNKIRTQQGSMWVTVPLRTKGHLVETLKSTTINNDIDWRRKHLGALQANYARAANFDAIFARLRPFYESDWTHLSDLCHAMLLSFLEGLSITTPVVKASELPPVEARKSDLVLELCRQAGATTYLSGSQGRDYLDLKSFADAGVVVEFQDYVHPVYSQLYPGFVPNMAVVDLLMCEPDPAKFFRSNSQLSA
jgi:hypothetical protein